MDIRTISSSDYSRPPASVVTGSPSASADTKANPPAAPFLSPVYRFDPLARLSVLTFRDSVTGDTTQQFPSAKVVAQYRRTRGEPLDGKESNGIGKAAHGTANAVGKESDTTRSAATGTSTAPQLPTVTSASSTAVDTAPLTNTPTTTKASDANATVQRVSVKV